MSGCHRVAQDAPKPNGKPCGVPGVAEGVPCPGPSAPSSSPTVTYNISNSYNTTNNYTTNNYNGDDDADEDGGGGSRPWVPLEGRALGPFRNSESYRPVCFIPLGALPLETYPKPPVNF